jgi:hypothetical protein
MQTESVRKPEEKKQLWRPSYRVQGNIKLDLKEVLCEDVKWFHVAEESV